MVEQVGHTAAFTEIATVLAERQAQVRCRAVAVIGKGLHQHGHATGAVALVAHLLQLRSVAALA